MKLYWKNHFRLFFFWVVLFLSGKLLFLAYHHTKTAGLSFSEILKVLGYGFWLDFSTAAYLSIIPFLVLLFKTQLPDKPTGRFLYGYVAFFSILTSFLTTLDLQLYNVWGFRLDNTPLQYLNTPGEMLASAAAAPVFLLFVIFIGFTAWALFLYKGAFAPVFTKLETGFLYYLTAFFFLLILILPIRGGWQEIPVNQSDVYFSTKPYPNHAAVNVLWNFGYSVSKPGSDAENPYKYLPESEAEKLVQSLFQEPAAKSANILNTPRPNILFIVLESFTAKLVGSLGGETGVTPVLDSLAKTGMAFTNFYAAADRSEKGIAALLSGYPAQPTTSVMKIPRKTENLPHLSKTLQANGYATSFFYGGELAFANIKSYLLTGGYNKLISKKDFPASSYNSKWGAHDHILLERVLEDLNDEKQPFFSTVFTLSSHEPFEVPMKTQFTGEDDPNLFRNSMFYTDQSIGKFLKKAKNQPWWKNTLVVLVADHGHTLPNNDPNDARSKFHIPLVLTGGALSEKRTIYPQTASQTDLAYSLLKQLNIPTSGFKWSQDIFNPGSNPFAFYVFNNGFGFVHPEGAYSFDNVSKKQIQKEGKISETDLKTGKAYMQQSYKDFLEK